MNIVVLDGGILNPGDISWTPLQALGNLVVYEDTAPGDVADRVKNANIVLVNKVKIDKSHIPALNACKLVGVLATGINNLDVAALKEAGIAACNVRLYGVEDVAQHAIALLMEICRNVGAHAQSVREGGWKDNWCYWLETPICLAGMTMGIVGFGAIGQCVGQIAHALGMSVLACNPSPRPAPNYAPFSFADMDELLAKSDALSLHCPLTDSTAGLINERAIQILPRGAIIINTSRGGLVDESAVARALQDGRLAGYGADVLRHEPPGNNSPLLSAPNTFITPHCAWASARARQNIIDIMAANIASWQKGHLQSRVA